MKPEYLSLKFPHKADFLSQGGPRRVWRRPGRRIPSQELQMAQISLHRSPVVTLSNATPRGGAYPWKDRAIKKNMSP